MTKVPAAPKPFKSSSETKTIYCFPPGTSETDKQHDIAEVEKFIAHVKSKRNRTKPVQKEE